MKQYVVDQLTGDDFEKLRSYLEENYGEPEFDSLFWLPIANFALSAVQQAHVECQPFYTVVELQPEQLICELLVRTKSKMRCSCMGYATEQQRNGIIKRIDDVLDQLEIVI